MSLGRNVLSGDEREGYSSKVRWKKYAGIRSCWKVPALLTSVIVNRSLERTQRVCDLSYVTCSRGSGASASASFPHLSANVSAPKRAGFTIEAHFEDSSDKIMFHSCPVPMQCKSS